VTAPAISGLVRAVQEHMAARRLDFLPYHFLLTSVGEAGVLRYQARRPCTCKGVPCCRAVAARLQTKLMLCALRGRCCETLEGVEAA